MRISDWSSDVCSSDLAAKLLALLQDSPLREARAETLDNLTASGPITASFMLDLPLHHGAPAPRIGGRIALAGASLGEKRWKLAFDAVHGEASYDHHRLPEIGRASCRYRVVPSG